MKRRLISLSFHYEIKFSIHQWSEIFHFRPDCVFRMSDWSKTDFCSNLISLLFHKFGPPLKPKTYDCS